MKSNKLHMIISRACLQLLQESVHDEETWNVLITKLKRAGLCETVTFDQWAKFQWTRHPVNLSRVQVASDPLKLQGAVAVISENLHRLFVREVSETSLLILNRLDAKILDRALTDLWLNHLTGDGVAKLILRDAIKPGIDQALKEVLN